MPIYILTALCFFIDPSFFSVPPMWKVESITVGEKATIVAMNRKMPRSEVIPEVKGCVITKKEAKQDD